ncbi:MAG: hypothetical protein JXB29_07300 [Sedimentisphaerales bacterium]|nr:hypothetical protein [Sedimentisphaerales bacterium]
MNMKRNTIAIFLCLFALTGLVYARDIYVNPNTGNDSADGLAPTATGLSGPVKTINQAVQLARPGDTIYLGGATFKGNGEHIGFYGTKSGEPGKPIIVDGQGAVIDGSVPLKLADWQQVSAGLYRNTTIFPEVLHSHEDWMLRFCFIFNGKLNRMGHSLKAPSIPYKKPEELQPGEWTYQKDEQAFYIKIDPTGKLGDYNIEFPIVVTGVQVHGTISHLVFKNITVTHVINDAFALTIGDKLGSVVRDILYKDCKAINVCDDGLSAHGDCDITVDGFLADDCSTGLASQGSSVNNRVVTRNIHGVDVFFGCGKHVITNSYFDCTGRQAPIRLEVWDNPYGTNYCHLILENVVVKGNNIGSNVIQLNGRSTLLECRQVTISGLSVSKKSGAFLRLSNSIVGGGSAFGIDVDSASNWQADKNIYDIGHIGIDQISYIEKDFDTYKKAIGKGLVPKWGKDLESKWMKVNIDQLLDSTRRPSDIDKTIGADMSLIPKPETKK